MENTSPPYHTFRHPADLCSEQARQQVKARVETLEELDSLKKDERVRIYFCTLLEAALQALRFVLPDGCSLQSVASVQLTHPYRTEPWLLQLKWSTDRDDALLSARLGTACLKLDRDIYQDRSNTKEALLQVVGHYLTHLQQQLSKLKLHPRFGYLVLIGDAGDHEMQALFAADVKIIKTLAGLQGEGEEYVGCIFSDPDYSSSERPTLNRYYREREAELIIVNNQPANTVRRVVEHFFSSPFLDRLVIYGGHGDEEGNMTFGSEDINFSELTRMVETAKFGQNGHWLLNCCWSHKLLSNPLCHTYNGLRVWPLTRNECPELPADGILGLLSRGDTPRDLRAMLKTFFPELNKMESVESLKEQIQEQRRMLTSADCQHARFRQSQRPSSAIEDGLFMFPAERGDTFLFAHKGSVLLFDSGYDWPTFLRHCWNPFIVPRVEKLTAVTSHVDQDHLAGLYKLLYNSNVNATGKHPHFEAIWINSDGKEASRGVNDGRMICKNAKERGIPLKEKIASTSDLALSFEVKVISPSLQLRKRLMEEGFLAGRSTLAFPKDMKRKTEDRSTHNLTAVALLIRLGDWSALLCSDVPQEEIEAGLIEKGEGPGPWHFTVVSVPHHGSSRNVAPDFFTRLCAQYYCVSTNSKHHGHPNKEAFVALAKEDATTDRKPALCSVYYETQSKMQGWELEGATVLETATLHADTTTINSADKTHAILFSLDGSCHTINGDNVSLL
jgi:beta-lactamase superfamily II metal-dependent hydrolase